MNDLGPRAVVPAAALPPVVHPAGSHLEPQQVEELYFERSQASEMQDETQEASATSSPDPLTLEVPEGRDIDVSQPPQSLVAYSSEA